MASKLNVLVAPAGRTMESIFSEEDLERLSATCNVIWGKNETVPNEVVDRCAPDVEVMVVGWSFERYPVRQMPRLRTVIEVTGKYPDPEILDYDYCFSNGIRVLSCKPAFAGQVAEMAVAMALDAAREITASHVDFMNGKEEYLWDGNRTAYSLFERTIGFIGYGGLARETQRLLAPWNPRVLAYDPWLSASSVARSGAERVGLEQLLEQSDVAFVTAMPTEENRQLLDRKRLEHLRKDSVLVLISRAHLVNFEEMTDMILEGRFRAAIDVFEPEPLPADHRIRTAPNAILSAHRAGSLVRDTRKIGRMVVDDLELIADGLPPAELQMAQPELIRRRGRPGAP